MIKKLKKNKFLIGIISIIIVYMILVSVQNPRFFYYSPNDDQYILGLADSLLDLKWLGKYNSVTLTKGIFSPLFIIFSNFLGIPLLISQSLFYVGACVLFVYVIRKNVIKNDWINIILFLIILFNPVLYSKSLLRIYRDHIYSSLLIYLVACAFGIFFNYKEKPKKIIGYMLGFGFSVTAMAICREESIWVAPFVLGSSIITILFILLDKQVKDKFKKISLYILPIIIYAVTIVIICFINYKYYGKFMKNEFSSSTWKNFLKAVSSVDVEKTYLTVPVTREARQKLYEVSPSFKELEPYFEGDAGDGWALNGAIPGELEAGWFQWAMVDITERAGYYTNAKTSNDFFKKITDEVNAAYDDGRLKKEDNTESIFDKDNFKLFMDNIKKTFEFQVSLKKVKLKIEQDLDMEEDPNLSLERVEVWRELTGHISTNSKTYNYWMDNFKINSLEKIKTIYQKFSPIIFNIAIILFIIELLRFFIIKPRFVNYKYLIVLLSLLMLYGIRLVVIAYTETALFEAINVMYLSSTYSMQFAFEFLSLVFIVYDIKETVNNRRKENKKINEA